VEIGVISDTHGDLSGWNKALGFFEECELIIHSGDILSHGPKNPLPSDYNPKALFEAINSCKIPIICAKGNCDSEIDQTLLEIPILSPYLIVQDGKRRIIAAHGHIMPDPKKLRADILITGHTHIPHLYEEDDVVYLNPGSPSIPLSEERTLSFAVISEDRITIRSLSGEPIKEWTLNP
jgi:hypothetical protein